MAFLMLTYCVAVSPPFVFMMSSRDFPFALLMTVMNAIPAFYGHGLGKYSNAIQKGRGYAWYNPEGKLLRYLRSIVRDPKNISAARNKLWGVSYHDAMGAMESFV